MPAVLKITKWETYKERCQEPSMLWWGKPVMEEPSTPPPERPWYRSHPCRDNKDSDGGVVHGTMERQWWRNCPCCDWKASDGGIVHRKDSNGGAVHGTTERQWCRSPPCCDWKDSDGEGLLNDKGKCLPDMTLIRGFSSFKTEGKKGINKTWFHSCSFAKPSPESSTVPTVSDAAELT